MLRGVIPDWSLPLVTMAGVVEMYLGSSSEYFALFGALTASYFVLKFASAIISGVKTFMIGSGIDFRKLGEWAGKYYLGIGNGSALAYKYKLHYNL